MRRQEVLRRYEGGSTYREIAAALDVSLGTVADDIRALTKDWRFAVRTDARKAQATAMLRLERIVGRTFRTAAQAFERPSNGENPDCAIRQALGAVHAYFHAEMHLALVRGVDIKRRYGRSSWIQKRAG